jgi:DeoR/GlpR family transcriptional regulator of sugar metabolism
MGKAERLEKIMDLIQNSNFISPLELAEKMDVSLVTIRRDLKKLAEERSIIKEYNTIKIARDYDKRFHERHNTNLEQKRIIAELAKRLVQSGDTLFLDTSTTCYEFARTLALSSQNLHIITNNIYMAVELMSIYKIDLVLLGGNIRHGYFSTIGPLAEKMLSNIKVNKFFFSCTMLDENGIYESNILEGNIKVKMFENSRLHYLLVDSTKFDKASIFRTTGIENIDALITDKPLPNEYLDILKDKNIEIITPLKMD